MLDTDEPHGPERSDPADSSEGGPRWIYVLPLVPVLTDIVETGSWPHAAREWFTEVAVGVLIALLVRRIVRQQRRLAALAHTDGLTCLGNRRAFDDALRDECARAQRSAQPLTLVYFDVDNFKQVNDSAGHGAGDEVLCQLADAIRHAVRGRVDRGFRVGGDEFALLLPGSTQAQAGAVAERVREHCVRGGPLWRDGPLGISAGAVEWQRGEGAQSLLQRADEAMFRAKREVQGNPGRGV
jgi:diguanylate cyclase (GGDEF)-like protein